MQPEGEEAIFTTQNMYTLIPGVYSVQVMDSKGCVSEADSFEIPEIPGLY